MLQQQRLMIERTLIEMDRRRYRWNDEELKMERGSAQDGARKCSRWSEDEGAEEALVME